MFWNHRLALSTCHFGRAILRELTCAANRRCSKKWYGQLALTSPSLGSAPTIMVADGRLCSHFLKKRLSRHIDFSSESSCSLSRYVLHLPNSGDGGGLRSEISVLLPFCSYFLFVCCELKKYAPISVHHFDRVRRRIDVGGFDSPPLGRKGAMLDFSLAQLELQVTLRCKLQGGNVSYGTLIFAPLLCYWPPVTVLHRRAAWGF